jgi:transcriptional regulator with XRE-family HTH domain
MIPERRAGADALRRLRLARGWSWADQARCLKALASRHGFPRIAAAQTDSIKRTIARWENGSFAAPGYQYQVLLAIAYARTPAGTATLGPGSDLAEYAAALAALGVDASQIAEVVAAATAAITATGTALTTFLPGPLRAQVGAALSGSCPVDDELLSGLAAASAAVAANVGTVPFPRLHLAHAAIADACRQLAASGAPDPVAKQLCGVTAAALAFSARLSFETSDDEAALAQYAEAAEYAARTAEPWRKAAVLAAAAMVGYYISGDPAAGRRTADAAVSEARRGTSNLVRARAHAVQAEMAARTGQRRHAATALHRAWHDLDSATAGDPAPASFSHSHMHGFDGICGIFLGAPEAAERQLTQSAAALTGARLSIQRAIVLGDRAIAGFHVGGDGAPEKTAHRLHECVDLISATRARVPALRLRVARHALSPWRQTTFVADLDDHIHSELLGR